LVRQEAAGPETFNIPVLARQSLSLYSAHPLQLVLIAAVGVPINFVVIQGGFLNFIWQIASLGLGELVFAALIYAAATARAGAVPDVLQSYRIALSKLATLLELLIRQLGAALLLAITIIGIPFAVRILVRWFFGTQAVVLNDLSAKEAISLSCRLVSGRWWRVAGTSLLVSVLFGGPAFAVFLAFGSSTASYVISSILSTIVRPFAAAFWTLLFLQLQDERAAAGGLALGAEPSP
jgi:hypothetical protein